MPEIKTVDEIIKEVSPYYKKKGEAECDHHLVYNAGSEALEPIYFWLIDLMTDRGLSPEKLVDNFTSTPGSSHYVETGLRLQRIQDEASKLLANAGIVLKSLLNIVYDLKEFKIRLQYYDDLQSKDKGKKEAAILSLKQIWMDKVDLPTKGNSSIKAMALGQAGYQTLIDAFLAAKTPQDIDKIDLNDRVKRILKPRINEFNIWLDQSEKELRKRFEMEKTHLKQQVSSLKLYSRWAKPYLRAAQQLEMQQAGREATLVNLFNTVRMELILLGKEEVDPEVSALAGDLPKDFTKLKPRRKYYACTVLEFTVNGIPQQGGRFTGKTKVSFKGYALNEDEIQALYDGLDKSDMGDVLNLIEGATSESLEQLQKDIDEFLEDKESEEKKKKSQDQSNPFMALLGFYNKKDKKQDKKDKKSGKKDKDKPVIKDNWLEKNHLRKHAAKTSSETCYQLMDVYKKAHGMASFT